MSQFTAKMQITNDIIIIMSLI